MLLGSLHIYGNYPKNTNLTKLFHSECYPRCAKSPRKKTSWINQWPWWPWWWLWWPCWPPCLPRWCAACYKKRREQNEWTKKAAWQSERESYTCGTLYLSSLVSFHDCVLIMEEVLDPSKTTAATVCITKRSPMDKTASHTLSKPSSNNCLYRGNIL